MILTKIMDALYGKLMLTEAGATLVVAVIVVVVC